MPEFNTVEELCNGIQRTLPLILEYYVYPAGVGIMNKEIQSKIYGKYNPSVYIRRYDLLNNPYKEIITNENAESVISITTNAEANRKWMYLSGKRKGQYHVNNYSNSFPGAFLKLLEGNNFGFWKTGFSRPVMSSVKARVGTGKEIPTAIRKGIDMFIK